MTVQEAIEAIQEQLNDLQAQEDAFLKSIEDNIAKNTAIMAEQRQLSIDFNKKKADLEAKIDDLMELAEEKQAILNDLKVGISNLSEKKAWLLTENTRLAKSNHDFSVYEDNARKTLENQDKTLQVREKELKQRELLVTNRESFLNH